VESFFASVAGARILVLGDLMLDQYLWGNMERISPEAPVPVVDVWGREQRLGGAANAALNAQALGAKVTLCGVVGADPSGEHFIQLADEIGLDIRFIRTDGERKTTTKTRIICAGQQVLRVDEEDRDPIHPELSQQLLAALTTDIGQWDAIIFSDYDKGFLDRELIQGVIQAARKHGISTTVDPKFRNFFHYSGCSLFKPNLKELNAALSLQLSKTDQAGIIAALERLQQIMPHEHSLITLSEQGMLLQEAGSPAVHFPAHRRQVVDVSGAGDTVSSVAALGIQAGLGPVEAARLANLAGGLVCEQVGVVPIAPEALRKAALRRSEKGEH
jgi:rfaE bifunctional protein kinase chain/domain